MDTIRGIITKILKKPDSPGGRSFVVASYEDETSGEMKEIRVGGAFGDLQERDAFEATGTWSTNTYRGEKQHVFNAKYSKPEFPATEPGIKAYLTGIFDYYEHGLRPRDIDDLLEALDMKPSAVIDHLTANPEVLVQACIDPERFNTSIRDTLKRRSSSKHATDLMKGANFDDGSIGRILSLFKTETLETLTDNPYEVMTIPTIDFEKADKLAKQLGVSKGDERRITAALWEHIRKAEAEGSTCVALKGAINDIAETHDISKQVVRDTLLVKVQKQDTDKFQVVMFNDAKDMYLMSDWCYRNEMAAANNLYRLIAKGRRNSPEKVEKVAEKILSATPFDYFQKQAVLTSSIHPISIIDGGPGTGKSTILESVIAISREVENSEIFLTAPTAKAAQRMEETTGVKATTLQKLLGMREEDAAGQKSFTYNRSNPLPENCVVVVDEFSMADSELFGAVVMAMPDSGRLILQGDKDQLESVGVGRVLADLLDMNIDGKSIVPISHLKNVYRQGKNSKISKDAGLMRDGIVPDVARDIAGGVSFQECKSKDICKYVVNMYRSTLKNSGLNLHKDVAVITPQAPGFGGTWELNQALAEELNPDRRPIPGLSKSKMDDPRMPTPHLGDRVMMTENDYDNGVVNGDVGIVSGYHPDPKTGKTMIDLEFDNGQSYKMPVGKWRNLILAYAITCHKAQGSQFSIVLMPFSEQHTNMAERNLTYTGWTRAKKMVVGIGDRDVFAKAVTNKPTYRYTLLRALTERVMRKRKMEPLGGPVEHRETAFPDQETFASKKRSTEAPKVKGLKRPDPPQSKETPKATSKKRSGLKLSLKGTQAKSQPNTEKPKTTQSRKASTGLKLNLKSRTRSDEQEHSDHQAPTPG